MQHARNEKRYIDGSNAQTEFYYDKNGNLIADFDRKICSIQYNVLSLPDTIQFSNGNQIVHVYDASGKRLQTTYYTRKVALVEPATSTLPGTVTNNTQLYTITSQTDVGNKRYKRYGTSGSWQLDYVFNPVGYLRCYAPGEHYPFYYIKDHIGNVRETYITPIPGEKYCEQRMQYYPSGLPWNQNSGASEQPFKYNGKEFIEMSGLDEYDSEARWYYPAILRTTTMDPLCEKYYSISPYAWCGNNPVNYVDPDGKIAIVASYEAQERLLSTLSCAEREFVSFDETGMINKELLNKCGSTSHNMTALKALTNSIDIKYFFYVQDRATNGSVEDMVKAGGVTEMYGTDKDPSPDPTIVNIISGSHLSGVDAAINMSHEAYVHAYLYEINGHDGRAASHNRPKSNAQTTMYYDPNYGTMTILIDATFIDHPEDILYEYDEKARNEASKNYNCE